MKSHEQVSGPKFRRIGDRIKNRLIEVKVGVTALRSIRAGVMELAYAMAGQPGSDGVLALPDVSVTPERLRNEWQRVSSVLRPDLLERLIICIRQGDRLIGIPRDPDVETQQAITDSIASLQPCGCKNLSRPDYSFIVMGLLVHQWLLGRGPMTRRWLMKTAGCSYPTVAAVLLRLDCHLVRHSDRRVELGRFPKEEWAGLVAVSEKARGTIRYADRSGQRRSAESLLRRLQSLKRENIAVGGIVGAKHYRPELDVVGTPRLDLSVHCAGETADLGFIERLDPALTRSERRDEPVSVAVHLVRRTDALFQTGWAGLFWADPVECLFDLHEARLEPQAREFLDSFPSTKGQI